MEQKNPCLETETSENHNVEQLPNGIALDEHGMPIDCCNVEEAFQGLHQRLYAHYGEPYRLALQKVKHQQEDSFLS